MKTGLPKLSIAVFVVSLLIGGYFFWRIKPLGFGTFPAVVAHLPITEGPQYQKKEDVYTAFYGNKANGVLYSVKKMPSADEAAANVRRQRESLIANQDSGAYARPFTLDKADDEKSGVLAYTQGELSNVVWAEGSRINFLFGSETYMVEDVADALRGKSQEPFSLYGLLKDLPARLRHWLGVLVPAVFATLALLVILSSFFGRKQNVAIV